MTKPRATASNPGSADDPPNADKQVHFPRHAPESAEFWNVRFAAGFTPWASRSIQAAVVSLLTSAPPSRVLIPGCGDCAEISAFCHSGWRVHAIDLSPIAVDTAKGRMSGVDATIEVADFFTFLPAFEPAFVYERAFLCALPPRLRQAWATRCASLLSAGGRLVGYFFIDVTERGPPFGIDESELNALLSKDFELLESAEVTDSIPVFAGRERWMVWQRRSAQFGSAAEPSR